MRSTDAVGPKSLNSLTMRNELKRIFLAVSIAAMAGSVALANGRNSSATEPLQPVFEQINQSYFGGQLKNVEVEWADLKTEKARGVTRFYDQGSVVVEIDRASNKNSRDVQVALGHEACHVATHAQIAQFSDVHGPVFQDCMRRFSNKKAQANALAAVIPQTPANGR